MDANDGEEIVNLAEVLGGLGDRARAPNSPTAAEEYSKRGALIAMFKRMHALPKNRVHCLKQGNLPAWCLQWPTFTSNPSTPVFFEDPAGAGRCVKLTIATPLTTQRTMKGWQAPPSTACCKARIMHVLLDPRILFALGLILTPRDRKVLVARADSLLNRGVERLAQTPGPDFGCGVRVDRRNAGTSCGDLGFESLIYNVVV
jgi:hypothetical protein